VSHLCRAKGTKKNGILYFFGETIDCVAFVSPLRIALTLFLPSSNRHQKSAAKGRAKRAVAADFCG
jgi:hypothetical protein